MKQTTLSKASKTPSSIMIYGNTLQFVGYGKYPYDCISKDKYPDAAIYMNTEIGAWTHEFAQDFEMRDESKDQYNQPLFMVSFSSAPLYKVMDCEWNRKHAAHLIGKYFAIAPSYCKLKIC